MLMKYNSPIKNGIKFRLLFLLNCLRFQHSKALSKAHTILDINIITLLTFTSRSDVTRNAVTSDAVHLVHTGTLIMTGSRVTVVHIGVTQRS